ncbi:MAG: methyltransferase domain-containing protein [Rhodospirillales bacterium]|nr:methyltransferase domain-containing protein [Rhodospirillales bacterium]
MDLLSVQSAYSRYSKFYDLLFGNVFTAGRLAAVQAINTEPGQRVLEVGVGTGLSLPMYREDALVTGIDVSTDMLDIARLRVAGAKMPQVQNILEMDAQNMSFSDNSFDSVVAMYTVSVVPDPIQMLNEIRRVCVPGGQFVLVNHFASRNLLVKLCEEALTPLSSVIGFRPNLKREKIAQLTGMELLETRAVNAFGYWTLMRFRNPG